MTLLPGPDHVGLVVPNLDAASALLCDVIGLHVTLQEPEATVEASALGLRRGRIASAVGLRCGVLRLRGALLANEGRTGVELHEFRQPPSRLGGHGSATDFGLRHIAWQTDAIQDDMDYLGRRGVSWYWLEPAHIEDEGSPYVGRWWMYGWAAALHTNVELFQD